MSRRATSGPGSAGRKRRLKALSRIAVGVDGYPEGTDAVVLGAALARATGAELTLIAVHPEPLLVLPEGMNWTSLERQAEAMLREARDALAPEARIAVETSQSVPRALERVVRREHRDLLVVGSSRHAPEGHVRIGKRTRQLLGDFKCALAIAPRGMHRRPDRRLAHIGVGYDGGAESDAAAVQRLAEPVAAEMEALREFGLSAARATGARARAEVTRGRPADALLELSTEVDMLVIGSRRWGPVARLLLGSTGEAVAHGAACPLVIVPRTRIPAPDRSLPT
jgi:nucleotide-binding universal stress UspA family protein